MIWILWLSLFQTTDDPIRWSVTRSSGSEVKLSARILDGWHLYSITQKPGGPIPTRITIAADQPYELTGEIDSSPPEVHHDESFDMDVEQHQGEAEFTLPIRLRKGAKSGGDLQIKIRFQTCSGQLCLPPKTVTAIAKVP